MPKFFVKEEQIKKDKIIIIGQDVNHIKKVLRAKIGDEIQILLKLQCKTILVVRQTIIMYHQLQM